MDLRMNIHNSNNNNNNNKKEQNINLVGAID